MIAARALVILAEVAAVAADPTTAPDRTGPAAPPAAAEAAPSSALPAPPPSAVPTPPVPAAPEPAGIAPPQSAPAPATSVVTSSPASVPVVPPEAQAPKQRRHRRLVVKLAAGAFYNRIFSVQAYGGEALLALGLTSDLSGWAIGLELARGRTEHGLQIEKVRVGWSYEWILNRFRLGLGPSIGQVSLERATLDRYPTRESDPKKQISVSLEGRASLDVVKTGDKSAFFVCASLKFDGPVWGPVLTLGYRAEVKTADWARSQGSPHDTTARGR